MKLSIQKIILLCAVTASSISAEGLYEIVIANNTTKPMQFSMRVAGLTNKAKTKKIKSKEPIMPGDAYTFTTSYLLLADTLSKGGLVITFKEGRKTIHTRYPIPVGQTGKDWVFAVSGINNPGIPIDPFVENWKICGSWTNTRLQHQATLGAELTGIGVGITGGLVAGGVLLGGAGALIATSAEIGEVLAGAAIGGAVGVGAGIGTTVDYAKKAKKKFGLSRKLHKDKCVKYMHKKKKRVS